MVSASNDAIALRRLPDELLRASARDAAGAAAQAQT
jgi:hypothetical protein